MIYPSTVLLQEVVTFTYRAPVFDLPGGLRGVNLPPLQEDDLPTETCLGGQSLGVGFDPPEGFQEQLDKTWGTKKFSARFARRLFVSQRLNL